MLYVISYDIPDNRRRSQLAKVLKGFGSRVQYSVFEAHLNGKQYEELSAPLHVLFIYLKIRCAITPSVVTAPDGSKCRLSVK